MDDSVAHIPDRFAEFARQLADAESSIQVLESAALQVFALVDCDRASVTVRAEDDPNFLVVHALEGTSVIPSAARIPMNKTAAGQAYRAGATEYTPDTSASPFLDSKKLAQGGIHSTVCAPLKVGGLVFGTLNFGRQAKGAFSPQGIRVLEAIASVIAVNLSVHDRLSQAQTNLRRSQELTDGLSKMVDLARTLFVLESEEEIYEAASRALPGILTADRWSFATAIEDDPGSLELRGLSGQQIQALKKRVPIEGTNVGACFREQRMKVTPDFREVNHPDSTKLVEAGLLSGVAIPITIGAECVGTLNAARRKANAFDDADVLLLNHCAATISQALSSARARRALRTAQRTAEEASQAKGAFVATVTHELRTPLNGVIGMAHVLASTALTQEQREAVETIRSSSELLLKLVSEVLDFSKVEAGKLELEVERFSLKTLIDETVATVRGIALDKGLRLVVDISPDVPEYWMGDALRLRQILTNLVSNALKFTERGQVTVRVRRRPPGGIRLEVEDTGMGIAPEARERIFDPFRQADSSTTRTHGGTGLGLALCRSIARAMGGEISVDGTEPHGSIFRADLPLKEPSKSDLATGAATEEFSQLDGKLAEKYPATVLVVDDNPVNLLVIKRLLGRLGYMSDEARSGQEAIELCAAKPYNLILLDLQMPGMDGIETMERIHQAEDAAPHIAMLTADSQVSTRTRCLDAGADGFLTKPIRMPKLVETLIQSSVKAEKGPGAESNGG